MAAEDKLSEMKPSAKDRLDTEPSWLIDGRQLFLDTGVIRLQELAYRDGAADERARIVGRLRERVNIRIASLGKPDSLARHISEIAEWIECALADEAKKTA